MAIVDFSGNTNSGGGGGGGTENAVLYTAQTLTSNQQEQARTNIGAGTFTKPSGGIPSSDMASAVQTSLGKADTAYQKPAGGIPAEDLASGVIPSVPVTDVTVGGTSVVSNGTAVVPAIPDAVEANPTVPSGTTPTDLTGLKVGSSYYGVPTPTVDNTPTKNSNNLVKSGGVYDEVHPATASSQPAGGMVPNVLYKLGTLTGSVTIAFATPADANIENEYKFTFTSDSTAPTITWPASITKWAGNALDSGLPNVEADTYYEVSVEDGMGIFNKFE